MTEEFDRDLERADRTIRALLWLALAGTVGVVTFVIYAVLRGLGVLP